MERRIDGYGVPVYHFDSAQERSKFLEEWLEDNYIDGMMEDKGHYMGRDAIYILARRGDTIYDVLVATI